MGKSKVRQQTTSERARELLAYDPETGIFRWRVARNSRAPVGSIAGTLDKDGYRLISIDGLQYFASRLVWLYVTGSWPQAFIDHANLKHDDNRFTNLREATNSQNMGNAPLRKTNKSGFKGVCWKADKRKWKAKLHANHKTIHLGYFDCPKLAHEAYLRAARKHYGEFARAR